MQVVGNATTSGQLHINPFGGNVGIGTNNSAAAKLVVNSTTAPTILVKNTAGNNAEILFEDNAGLTQNAKITFDQAGGNQLYITTGYDDPNDLNRIYFQPGGETAMTIRGGNNATGKAGNVGIGTTSPNHKLQVEGGSAESIINLTTNGNPNGLDIIAGTDGHAALWLRENSYMHFATNNVERMRILANGNVGIGTTAPGASKLDVRLNDSYGAYGTNQGLSVTNETTTGDAGFVMLKARYNNSSPNTFYQVGGMGGGKETALGNNQWGGYLSFFTTSDGSAGAASGMFEHMRITADGNVGIGNTAPVEKLQVSGNIFAQTNIIDADASNANPNLLTQACIKMSLESDIYVNASRVIINEYEARFTNDGTGASTIRLDAQSSMTAGQAHTFSIYYKDLIGTLSIDIGDIGVTGTHTSATGTSGSPTSGRIYGTAIKPTSAPHNGYNFIDINFSTNGAVTLLHPKVEVGSVPTKFVTTTEAESDPQTLTTNNIITTGDINLGGNSLLGFEHQEVDSTTANIASVDKVKFTAAFFDYVIKKGTNIRAGVVYACHDGTNVEFSDVSTVDLGDTSTVTFSAIADSTKMILRATTTTDDWHIKTLIRAL